MSDEIIIVVDIINSQYVLKENFTKLRTENSTEFRTLTKLSDLEIRI